MRTIFILPVLLVLVACVPERRISPAQEDAALCRPVEGSSYCLMMKDPKGQDVPLCATTVSGGGGQGIMFGPMVRSSRSGQCQQDVWFDANDQMYRRGNNAIIGCVASWKPPMQPELADIMSSGHVVPKVVGNRIYLEATYTEVSPTNYQKACERLQANAFTWDEKEGRELFSLGPTAVELHSDEYRIRPVWVYFDWPSPVPHLQLTPP